MELFYTNKLLDNDAAYQKFISDSPGIGYLKIRASSANEAIPVEGLRIIVSKNIGSNKVIFFEGKTDYSGMINNIVLPAPKPIDNDEIPPTFNSYDVEAINNDIDNNYNISVCCGFTVIQYINVIPSTVKGLYGN